MVVVSSLVIGVCVFSKKTIDFSVFWDLYCAAPERRDTCEHSSEAKAFHDYVSTVTCVRSDGSILGSLCGNVALCERSTRYIGPDRSCTCLRRYFETFSYLLPDVDIHKTICFSLHCRCRCVSNTLLADFGRFYFHSKLFYLDEVK